MERLRRRWTGCTCAARDCRDPTPVTQLLLRLLVRAGFTMTCLFCVTNIFYLCSSKDKRRMGCLDLFTGTCAFTLVVAAWASDANEYIAVSILLAD